MLKKTSSNQPCGKDSEYIIGAFLKSFSIYDVVISLRANLLSSIIL